MIDLVELTNKIGPALACLVAEHGAPNSFGCGEVAAYLNVSPMLVGRVMRTPNLYAIDVIESRAKLTGRVTYDKRRFVVAGDPTEAPRCCCAGPDYHPDKPCPVHPKSTPSDDPLEGATLEGYREYLRKGGTLR